MAKRPPARSARRSSIQMIASMHENDHTFQDTEHGKMLLNPMGVHKKTLDQHMSERAILGREIDTHARAARAVLEEEQRLARGGAVVRPGGGGAMARPATGLAARAGQRPATTHGGARGGGGGKQQQQQQRTTEVDFLAVRRARAMMGARGRRASWLQPHVPRPPTTLASQIEHYDKTMHRVKTTRRQARRASAVTHKFGDFINSHKQRVRDIFDKFDEDGDGTLSVAEFQKGLTELGLPMTREEVEITLGQVNSDGDDTVSFEELKGYLKDNTKRTRRMREEAKRPPPVRVLTPDFWKELGADTEGDTDENVLRRYYESKGKA